jgi:hypothetical protein
VANTNYSISNKVDGYQSFSQIFPAQICFDYKQINLLFRQLEVERIKGIIKTTQGWFIVNGTNNNINYVPISPSNTSRIEIIARENNFQDISNALSKCIIEFSIKKPR